MTRKAGISGDRTPVTGGIRRPADLIATPDKSDDNAPDDDLGRQIVWLLKLHPEACLKFRKSDISAMDDDTKRTLIADIQHALGVMPITGDRL
jgi:hypothetical protein